MQRRLTLLILVSIAISACSDKKNTPVVNDAELTSSVIPQFANTIWRLITTTSNDGINTPVANGTRYQIMFKDINDDSNLGSYTGDLNCTAIEGSYRFDNNILMMSLPVLDQPPCFDYEEMDAASLRIFEQGFSGSPLIVEISDNLLKLHLQDNSSLQFTALEAL